RDLETIVVKAMDREPSSRYASAAEMAEDLRQFLADRPVKARRTSSIELAARWCRRNPALASLVGTVALLLLVVAIGSSISAAWLKKERDAAVDARKETTDANIAMKEKLWQSLRDQARAGVLSRRRGQRFESLEAIRAATNLGHELALPPSKFDELRD